MIILIGKIGLWLALVCSLIQASECAKSRRLLVAGFILIGLLLSFGALTYAYLISDFSLLNVFENSHSHKPLLYKLTGVWGNHEGSLLLLTLILACYHLYLTLNSQTPTKSIQLHALLICAFLAFIMFASDPFIRLNVTPAQGLDLNPLLQDIGLAIHPPILYTGYMGFSVVFVNALVLLSQQQTSNLHRQCLKQPTLFAWTFLSLGIALGSWWAYRELGWGGFWFWDPVENVSLMPWLSSTALIHSLIVFEKRQHFAKWTILLAISTFLLCLIGFFLVRSGILTSVHAFGQDPERGLYILGFLSAVGIGSMAVYAKYAITIPSFRGSGSNLREFLLALNNLLLVIFCLTILLGTLYPIILQLTHGQFVTVAAPYFNTMLTYMGIPLFILAIVAPYVPWQNPRMLLVFYRLLPSLLAGIIAAYVTGESYLFSALGWILIFASIQHFVLFGWKNFSYYGMTIAHIGLGLLIVSVNVTTHQQYEVQKMLKHNETVEISGFEVTLKNMTLFAQDNYLLRQGEFEIRKDHKLLTVATPQVRFYPAREQNTYESSIYRYYLSDLYLVMGETNGVDAYQTRIYYRPMINGIWLSAALIALGGLMALLRKSRRT